MDWTREEFAAAVTENSRAMFRAARSVLDSDADGEDAVAQAVLQAWQSRERRVAVTLFYYEGLTVEQIAKCLGVPKGTVKSRLSRARKQLKEMLCDEEGSYGTV